MSLSRTRRRYPHRCMAPVSGTVTWSDGRTRTRRCLKRATFDHWGDHPRCESCGSTLHWVIEKHRAANQDRNHCTDSACPYHYPHDVLSEHCVNNPRRDPYGVTEALGVKLKEPDW